MVNKKKSVIDIVEQIVKPVTDELGILLWDIRFEKEGASWYLRIFIDKDGGVNIDDCESVSRKINPMIDEIDPIEQSYFLEVSSPGLNRRLVKKWHLEKFLGNLVDVKLFKAVDSVKNFTGTLSEVTDEGFSIIIGDDDKKMELTNKEVATLLLHEEF